MAWDWIGTMTPLERPPPPPTLFGWAGLGWRDWAGRTGGCPHMDWPGREPPGLHQLAPVWSPLCRRPNGRPFGSGSQVPVGPARPVRSWFGACQVLPYACRPDEPSPARPVI